MKKTKENYKMLASIDKAMKNEYMGLLWEAIGKCHPEFIPTVLKGVRIMKPNRKTQPAMGILVFFDLKSLGMAYIRMFGLDQNQMLAEGKAVYKFTLELNQKFKLKTDLICLHYEIAGYPIQFDWIHYDAVNDRMYGSPSNHIAEEFDYLKGPLVLSSPGSDQIITIYSGGPGGHYTETKGKPETRRFVTNEEALSKFTPEQISTFKKMRQGSSSYGKDVGE